MIECETRLKAWGNSVGIVIPKDKLRTENLKPDQRVRAIIMPAKTVKVKEIFGKLKRWQRPTSDIMRRVGQELGSKIVVD